MKKQRTTILIREDHLKSLINIKDKYNLSLTAQIEEAYQNYIDNFDEIQQSKSKNLQNI